MEFHVAFKINYLYMKSTIIKFGIRSGIIAAIMLAITTAGFQYLGIDKFDNDYSMIFGYAGMLVSMSMIYFGIKNYRDQQNNCKVTFLNGLLFGLGIMLISCIFYSLMWLIIYYNFFPNFMDEYAAAHINKAKEAGASIAELAKTTESMNQMKDYYKSPFMIFFITLLEPTPVGFLFSIISAMILKRK
jgi:Protein of unknown function (DUF4199)